jgi:hypothetical protein
MSSGFGTGFSFKNFSPIAPGFGSGFTKTISLIRTGLVLHYDISDASSYPGNGATVTDLEGNSNASLGGSPSYSSGYLTFNGTNQHLLTSTSLASKVPTDLTTISMWAYPMDNGVLLSEVGSAALPNAAGWHETQMEMVAGTMKFGMWNGISISSITSEVATPLNNWYHFAIAYDGTKLNAYVNGVAAGSATFARLNPVEDGNGLFYAIAATDITNMGDGSYANMRLGQFLVYNRSLSSEEIVENYKASKTRFGL